MGIAQQRFDAAVKSYDEAIALIKALDEAFQNAVFKDSPEKRYNTKITLAQFDLILQAILLQQAVADGNFDNLERQFVEKITDYGDLLDFIRQDSKGQLELTWTQLANVNNTTQQKLVAALPNILDRICSQFVMPLALMDAVVEMDVLDKLEHLLMNIAGQLANLDGSFDDSEAQAFAAGVVDLLDRRWKEIVQKAGN